MTATWDDILGNDLGAEVKAVRMAVGKPKFDESDHPRDRQGRFIETGSTVRLLGGATGTVLGKGTGDRIKVRRDDDGKTYEVDKQSVTVTARPDGGAPTDREEDAPTAITAAPAAAATPDPADVTTWGNLGGGRGSVFDSGAAAAAAPTEEQPFTDTEMSVEALMAMRIKPGGQDETLVAALAERYRRDGYTDGPIQVEETNRDAIVTDGHHRLAAAEQAGLELLPARVFANTPAGRAAANRAMADAERAKVEAPPAPEAAPEAARETTAGGMAPLSTEPGERNRQARIAAAADVTITGRRVEAADGTHIGDLEEFRGRWSYRRPGRTRAEQGDYGSLQEAAGALAQAHAANPTGERRITATGRWQSLRNPDGGFDVIDPDGAVVENVTGAADADGRVRTENQRIEDARIRESLAAQNAERDARRERDLTAAGGEWTNDPNNSGVWIMRTPDGEARSTYNSAGSRSVEFTPTGGEVIRGQVIGGNTPDEQRAAAKTEVDRIRTFLTTDHPEVLTFSTEDEVRAYYAAGAPHALRRSGQGVLDNIAGDTAMRLIPGSDGGLGVWGKGNKAALFHVRSGMSIPTAHVPPGRKNVERAAAALVEAMPDAPWGADGPEMVKATGRTLINTLQRVGAEMHAEAGNWKADALEGENRRRIDAGESPLLPDSGVPRKVKRGRTSSTAAPELAGDLQPGDIVLSWSSDDRFKPADQRQVEVGKRVLGVSELGGRAGTLEVRFIDGTSQRFNKEAPVSVQTGGTIAGASVLDQEFTPTATANLSVGDIITVRGTGTDNRFYEVTGAFDRQTGSFTWRERGVDGAQEETVPSGPGAIHNVLDDSSTAPAAGAAPDPAPASAGDDEGLTSQRLSELDYEIAAVETIIARAGGDSDATEPQQRRLARVRGQRDAELARLRAERDQAGAQPAPAPEPEPGPDPVPDPGTGQPSPEDEYIAAAVRAQTAATYAEAQQAERDADRIARRNNLDVLALGDRVMAAVYEGMSDEELTAAERDPSRRNRARAELARRAAAGGTPDPAPTAAPDGIIDASTVTTGEPVRLGWAHRTQNTGNAGRQYGQDVEPAGRYLSARERGDTFDSDPNVQTGVTEFANPLVLEFGGGYTEDSNWKRQLSEQYNGLTGAELSQAVRNDGHDVIITRDRYGFSEVVDLTSFTPADGDRDRTPDSLGDPDGPWETVEELPGGYRLTQRPSPSGDGVQQRLTGPDGAQLAIGADLSSRVERLRARGGRATNSTWQHPHVVRDREAYGRPDAEARITGQGTDGPLEGYLVRDTGSANGRLYLLAGTRPAEDEDGNPLPNVPDLTTGTHYEFDTTQQRWLPAGRRPRSLYRVLDDAEDTDNTRTFEYSDADIAALGNLVKPWTSPDGSVTRHYISTWHTLVPGLKVTRGRYRGAPNSYTLDGQPVNRSTAEALSRSRLWIQNGQLVMSQPLRDRFGDAIVNSINGRVGRTERVDNDGDIVPAGQAGIRTIPDAAAVAAGDRPELVTAIGRFIDPRTRQADRAGAWRTLDDARLAGDGGPLERATALAALPRAREGRSFTRDLTNAQRELDRLEANDPTHPLVAERTGARVTVTGLQGTVTNASYTGRITGVSTTGPTGGMTVTVQYRDSYDLERSATVTIPGDAPSVTPADDVTPGVTDADARRAASDRAFVVGSGRVTIEDGGEDAVFIGRVERVDAPGALAGMGSGKYRATAAGGADLGVFDSRQEAVGALVLRFDDEKAGRVPDPFPAPAPQPVLARRRAGDLAIGERVAIDGEPVTISGKRRDGRDLVLSYRPDSDPDTEWDLTTDDDEELQVIAGGSTPVAPLPDETAGDDDPDGNTPSTAARLTAGQRFRHKRAIATVVEVRDTDDPDVVDVEVEARGVRTVLPMGRDGIIDLLDEGDLPAPSRRVSRAEGVRPAIYSYQRRRLVALGLDYDGDDQVAVAAQRIRLRQAITPGQAQALAGRLRELAGQQRTIPQQRALARLADRMEVAALESNSRRATAVFDPGSTPHRGTVADLTEGDEVAFVDLEGNTVSGKLTGLRVKMSGRLYEVELTGADGTVSRHLLSRDTVTYRFGDLPDPEPVAPPAPARVQPVREHITGGRLNVGDTIEAMISTSGIRGEYEVIGLERSTRTGAVTVDLRLTTATSLPPENVRLTEGRDGGPTIIRTGRGDASAAQPWDATMPDENPEGVQGADLVVGDRVMLADLLGGSSPGMIVEIEGIRSDEEAGDLGASMVSVRHDNGVENTYVIGDGQDVTRLVRADADAVSRIAAARLERERVEKIAGVKQILEANVNAGVASLAGQMRLRALRLKTADLIAVLRTQGRATTANDAQRVMQILTRDGNYGTDVNGARTVNVNDPNIAAVRAALDQQWLAQRDAMADSLEEAVRNPLPNESPGEAVSRVLQQWQQTPPAQRDTAAIARGLLDGWERIAATEAPDGDIPAPGVPELPANANMRDRMRAYRNALPDQGGFGRVPTRRVAYGKIDIDALERGEMPPVVITTAGDIDLHPGDKGPGEHAMAHLDVVMAAGRDLRQAWETRIAAKERELGVDDADEGPDVPALKAEHVAASQRLERRRTQEQSVIAARNGFSSWVELMSVYNAGGRGEARMRAETAAGDWRQWNNNSPELRSLEAAALEAQRAWINAHNAAVRGGSAKDKLRGEARRLAALELLAEVRPDGVGGHKLEYVDPKTGRPLTDRAALVKAARYAEAHYPNDWLKALDESMGGRKISLAKVARGSYGRKSMKLSARPAVNTSDPSGMGGVSIHELGHGMEETFPDLVAAERAFLWSRTSTGDIGSRAREKRTRVAGDKATSQGYKDEFKNHYTGRTYGNPGDPPGVEAFEVFTTGVESIFAGSAYTDNDPGFVEFILGSMALIGRDKDPEPPAPTLEEVRARSTAATVTPTTPARPRRPRRQPAPDTTTADEAGVPLRLSYSYLSELDEDGLDQLATHILGRMDDGDAVEGQRWEDYELFMAVQQGQDALVDDLAGSVSDDEVTAAVNAFLDANGRPGLTHPAVGGRGGAVRSQPTRAEVQAEYATFIELQYLAAEEATRGHMLNARAERLGIHPRALFSGDVRDVYRHASPELLEFWETTKRVGWSEYYYERTGSPGAARAARNQREQNARINRDRTEGARRR